MSKPVKQLVAASYRSRFADTDGAVLIDIRGVKSNHNNELRAGLAADGVRVTVVKNSLARQAVADTPLQDLGELMTGPSAVVYGGESVVQVARKLIELAKGIENLEFKGALMEGQMFGPDQIDALSKYPTRDEAIGQAVQLILSPGSNLVATALGPGRKIASLVKAIQEKQGG